MLVSIHKNYYNILLIRTNKTVIFYLIEKLEDTQATILVGV